MKIARWLYHGQYHEGVVHSSGRLVDEAGHSYEPDAVVFLAPVEPRKIIGLALNYAKHADELELATPKEPALFFKPPTSIIGHRGSIIFPTGAKYMHYENELAVVIGRRCRRVRASNAMEVVAGYTIANDVTVRDFIHNTYRPPIKAKGWDTFLPLGPYLTVDEIADPHSLELRTFVNGQLRQSGNTSDLLIKIPGLIEYLSEFMTLEEGDVLLTGTPMGLTHLYPGDNLRLEIDGLGTLENVVEEEGSERVDLDD